MRGGRDHVLADQQVVRLIDLPVANQLHHPIGNRGQDISGEDDPRADPFRAQGDDPMHSPGLLELLRDRVGSVLLNGEAESEHAASLGSGWDA